MRKICGLMIFLCLVATTSCIRFHGPEDLRRDLARTAGVKLDREMGVTLTRTAVMLARWATSEEEIPLRGVRRVEVGTYRVQGLGRGVEQRRPIDPPELPGWQTIVRVREDNEDIFVLLREEEDEIRGLLIVVAEEDEWALVRIRGRLQHTLEGVMELAFDRAERPDLYEPVLAEYRGDGRDGLQSVPPIELADRSRARSSLGGTD